MTKTSSALVLALALSACASTGGSNVPAEVSGWKVDFFDDFDTFNTDNWQDQILWVNDEDQCYVRDGEGQKVSDPDYLGALQSLRSYGPRLVPVPMDADGMRTDVLVLP